MIPYFKELRKKSDRKALSRRNPQQTAERFKQTLGASCVFRKESVFGDDNQGSVQRGIGCAS